MPTYTVYMLRCADATYYTGVTSDLSKRLHQHATDLFPGSYTSRRKPLQLVYSHSFASVHEAIRWEKIVKDWSVKKKEALIRGDFDAVRLLGVSKVSPAKSNGSRSARTDKQQ